MQKRIKLLSAAVIIFSAACGQKSSEQETSQKHPVIEGWKTLDDRNYAIQYPEEWALQQNGLAGTRFILLSALTSPQDQFRENVTLLSEDLTGQNMDLDKYASMSEEQIKTMITNCNIVESKRVDSGNGPYQKEVYSGDQGIYKLKFEQYYWVIDNKAYVLTLTAEKDHFDEYKNIGEKILDSFYLKNN